MSVHSLILAGGEGKRFWPLSTMEKPKQFLNFLDENTLLQNTWKRIFQSSFIDQHWVITQKKYQHLVSDQLPFLEKKNILLEPIGKNTLPTIAYSAYQIFLEDPQAYLIVLPADHFIQNESVFLEHLSVCISHLDQNQHEIITLGVQPDFPNTQYGYIHSEKQSTDRLQKVLSFKEKPDLKTAEEFLKTSQYYWNTGIFIFKAKTLVDYIEKNQTEIYEVLKVENNWEEKFQNLPTLSFDHGVMEKYPYIRVLPSFFTWSDLGTWESIYRYLPKDKNQNAIQGEVLIENVQDCLIINHQKRPVQLKDLEGICCVFTQENTFIQKRQL